MTGKGVAVAKDVGAVLERFEQALGHQQSTKRCVCRCNALCAHQHVWLEAIELAGKHGADAAEAVDGFVSHKQHVVFVADLANALVIRLRCGETTTRVLHRFHKEGRNCVWVFEQNHFFDSVGRPKSEGLFVFELVLRAIPVGVWHSKCAWH